MSVVGLGSLRGKAGRLSTGECVLIEQAKVIEGILPGFDTLPYEAMQQCHGDRLAACYPILHGARQWSRDADAGLRQHRADLPLGIGTLVHASKHLQCETVR